MKRKKSTIYRIKLRLSLELIWLKRLTDCYNNIGVMCKYIQEFGMVFNIPFYLFFLIFFFLFSKSNSTSKSHLINWMTNKKKTNSILFRYSVILFDLYHQIIFYSFNIINWFFFQSSQTIGMVKDNQIEIYHFETIVVQILDTVILPLHTQFIDPKSKIF